MRSVKLNFKRATYILVSLAFILVLSGCAESVDLENCMPDKIYGFWHGLWHGLISLVTFIISLFDDDVTMYACNNNGGWYNFGFLIGVSIVFGGGTKASSKRK